MTPKQQPHIELPPPLGMAGQIELSPVTLTQGGSEESANVRRMREENLITFAVLSSHDIAADTAELRRLNDWVSARFAYYEILIVSGQTTDAWRRDMRTLGAEIPKFRMITLGHASQTDNFALAALEHSIGDFAVLVSPGEIGLDDLSQLVTRMADGQSDLIKTHFHPGSRSPFERMTARATQVALRIVTGRRFARFPARATIISRAGITRILATGGPLRYFRLLNVSDLLSEERIELSGGDRSFWGDLSTKIRVTGEIVSISAPRMVRLLALLCFILGVLSFCAGIAAFFTWLLMPEVAPGWTSLVMLLSFLFSSNFLVLGAVCLGLVRILSQTSKEHFANRAIEFSSGELFKTRSDLNVDQNDQTRKG